MISLHKYQYHYQKYLLQLSLLSEVGTKIIERQTLKSNQHSKKCYYENTKTAARPLLRPGPRALFL